MVERLTDAEIAYALKEPNCHTANREIEVRALAELLALRQSDRDRDEVAEQDQRDFDLAVELLCEAAGTPELTFGAGQWQALAEAMHERIEELRGHVEKLVMTIENVVSCLSAGAEWRDVRMAHDDLEKSLTPAVREIAEQVRKGREEKDAEKTSTD